MKPESVALFFNQGSSDKVYNASLDQDKKGWTVKFSYGRRGSALVYDTKAEGATYDVAKDIYDKLVKSKMVKGYQQLGGAKQAITASIPSASGVIDTGWLPQLLNEISEDELEGYLTNPEFCAQEKFDGRNRLLLMEKGTGAAGTNRKGISVDISNELKTEMSIMSKGDVIAGEDLGEHVACFDLISQKGLGYKERLKLLNTLLSDDLSHMKSVYTAFTEKEKRALLAKLKKENAEGIVFKNLVAHYTPGRPASGGAQLKYKFTASCSVIAGSVNKGKRSVEMWVSEGKNLVNVGNLTIYPNQEIPKPGDILEVKYLYAYKGGSLFQPVYLGPRDDIDKKACVIGQLKYKQEE